MRRRGRLGAMQQRRQHAAEPQAGADRRQQRRGGQQQQLAPPAGCRRRAPRLPSPWSSPLSCRRSVPVRAQCRRAALNNLFPARRNLPRRHRRPGRCCRPRGARARISARLRAGTAVAHGVGQPATPERAYGEHHHRRPLPPGRAEPRARRDGGQSRQRQHARLPRRAHDVHRTGWRASRAGRSRRARAPSRSRRTARPGATPPPGRCGTPATRSTSPSAMRWAGSPCRRRAGRG